jgi:hypothetical protein
LTSTKIFEKAPDKPVYVDEIGIAIQEERWLGAGHTGGKGCVANSVFVARDSGPELLEGP